VALMAGSISIADLTDAVVRRLEKSFGLTRPKPSDVPRAAGATPSAKTKSDEALQSDAVEQRPKHARAMMSETLNAKQKIGLLAAAMVRGMQEEGLRGPRVAFRMLDEMGYGALAKEFDASQRGRSLSSGSAAAGGILLPETMAPDIVDILRPTTTFLQGEPIMVSMPTGSYKQPAGASGATAAYRREGAPIPVSQPTFRSINMTAKLLSGMVLISDQLIRYSLGSVQTWVENDLSQAMGLAMDQAAYRGDGLYDSPLGITRVGGIFRQPVATATVTNPTAAAINQDARRLELQLEGNGVPMIRVEWRMHPRVFGYLKDLLDGNGNRSYPELSQPEPYWRGFRVRTSSQIPANLGDGTNESEIYLIAFGHVLFGNAMAMQLSLSHDATIVSGGNTIHTFQEGITAIKAESEHDFDIRFAEAVAVLTSVKWGS
jgi:HK97 family phage major capsid protein